MANSSVLISGAGPSGLILALVLLQNGVSVRIIDKEMNHRGGSRGSGIQARTLELYDILGVLPNILKAGDFVTPVAMYQPGKLEPEKITRLAEHLEPTPDTPYPNGWSLSQDIHEEILRAYMQTYSCSVELGSELRSLEQFPDHVVAHIVKTDAEGKQSEESTRFDWLVGTDGAHSVVRKQLGLSFLGESRKEEYLCLGDIAVEEGMDPSFWHIWHVPPRLLALRSQGPTNKVFMFGYTGMAEKWLNRNMTREEFIEEFYDVTGRRDVKFGAATWLSTYRPNMRMVDKMGVGRVFVAGDAAHCHSPTGGQGLNSSVQDVANLGWKLALVHKGLASPSLLDTYSEERLRVIAQMLKLTTDLFNKNFGSLKDREMDEGAWKRGGDLRMLGVNYCGSSIVQEEDEVKEKVDNAYLKSASTRVQAAYRAPDAPALVRSGGDAAPTTFFTLFSTAVHTVLIFGADEASRAQIREVLAGLPKDTVRAVQVLPQGQSSQGQTADVLVLEDREGHAYKGYGLPADQPTIVVVRPDGVVGTVVPAAEGVKRYFQKIFL
ncbi:FAD-binding-3 domain-containing protein [Favolaschia claudopus]|uniref:FAD-binding-3 domain-containing protein n=1 Tax=Favolaschia claudopus TaxID=2862362 RepID=A0AAW0EAK2_9AGAR